MKQFIQQYAYKFYLTSKLASWLYPNDFIWTHVRHHKEIVNKNK